MKLKVVAITETGDEVIHLFYNSGDNRDDIAGKTYLYDGEGFGGSFTITIRRRYFHLL